jgi:hypothetical protein
MGVAYGRGSDFNVKINVTFNSFKSRRGSPLHQRSSMSMAAAT